MNTNTNEREATNTATAVNEANEHAAVAEHEKPTDHGLERLRTANEAKRGPTATANEAQRGHEANERPREATKPTIHEATITIQKATKPTIHEAVASLAVYVPSTTNEHEAISQREFTKRTDQVSRSLASLFGGVTVWPCLGYWLNEAGILVNERINVVRTNTDPASLAEHYDQVMAMVITNGRSWSQTAMAVDINGSMNIITL